MSTITTEITADTSNLTKGINKSKAKLNELSNAGKSLMSDFAGLAIGGGVIASLTAVKSIIDDFDRLGDLSNRLGVDPETMQRLGTMAKMSGSDIEALAKSLTYLEKNMNKAGGMSDDFSEALKTLGIDASAFKSMTLDQKVIEMAKGFNNCSSEGAAMSASLTLLGKGAGDLIPLLKTSAEELQSMSDNTHVVSNEEIAMIQEANDKIDMMTQTVKEFVAITVVANVEAWTGAFQSFKDTISDVAAAVTTLQANGKSLFKDGFSSYISGIAENVTYSQDQRINDKVAEERKRIEEQKKADKAKAEKKKAGDAFDIAREQAELAKKFSMVPEEILNMDKANQDFEKARKEGAIKSLTWDMTKYKPLKDDSGRPGIFSSMARIGGDASKGFSKIVDNANSQKISLLKEIAVNTKKQNSVRLN